MDGYIKLSRRLFNSCDWEATRAISDREAWIDLIQSARFEATPTTSSIGGCEVTWGRGQYPASVRFLARKWNWPERHVRTFLSWLKKRESITIDNSQGISVITLVNYDKYNGDAPCDTPSDTPSDTSNTVNYNDLQALVTQLVTQELTHLEEKRHTSDTKKKKGEEREKENMSAKAAMQKKSGAVASLSAAGASDAASGQKSDSDDFSFSGSEAVEASTTAKAEERKVPPAPERKGGIGFKALQEFFNAAVSGSPGIPRITAMTEARKAWVNARVQEYGAEAVRTVIAKAARSTFLNGGGDTAFVASFDWLMRPRNFPKVLEGNYDDRPQPAARSRPAARGGILKNVNDDWK